MSDEQSNSNRDALDRATSDRLAKLRAIPVDTTELDRRMRMEIPFPAKQRIVWFKPLRIAAALVLAAGVIAGALVLFHETPAVASAAELVRLHEEVIAGRGHVMQVQSLDEASRVLSEQWAAKPDLPEMPGAEVMSCCLHEMGKARMAAVTMSSGGTPITMAVADADDMRSPRSPTIERNGVTWHVQSAEGINMVSAKLSGRWICLMGRLPTERLMTLAQSLKF